MLPRLIGLWQNLEIREINGEGLFVESKKTMEIFRISEPFLSDSVKQHELLQSQLSWT